MPDITALELGPCTVEYGTSGSEVDLGFTMGGVTVTVTTDVAEVMTDQFGKVVMKQIVVGRTATIKVPFAETNLSLMSKIIPLASYVADTFDPTLAKTLLNTPIGSDLLASAAYSLRLTKAIGAVKSSNTNDVFRFYKAAPSGKVEFAFSIKDQRVFETEFTAYPDSTQSYSLGVFGSEQAV